MRIEFLETFIDWLDVRNALSFDNGILNRETMTALRLTSCWLVEFSRYCLDELNLKYMLLGKIQTDSLEAKFGQYGQLAGG